MQRFLWLLPLALSLVAIPACDDLTWKARRAAESCSPGQLSCQGTIKLVCENGTFIRSFDCADTGRFCEDGSCVLFLDGDWEEQNPELDSNEGEKEVEREDESEDGDLENELEAERGDEDAQLDSDPDVEELLDAESDDDRGGAEEEAVNEKESEADREQNDAVAESETPSDGDPEVEQESEKEPEPEPLEEASCDPQATSDCNNGDVYWRDCHDAWTTLKEDCGNCECQSGDCVSNAQYDSRCQTGDVYWFDCFGNPGQKKEDCGFCGCQSGNCIPDAEYDSYCQAGDVYWLDCFGNQGQKKEECDDCACVNKGCVANAQAATHCYDDDLYWFDCHRAPQAKKQECGLDGCAGDTCAVLFCALGICYDPSTGFEWQETPVSEAASWLNAVSECNALSLSGTGWRLPNVTELRSLMRGCQALRAGGACAVNDSCPACGLAAGQECLGSACFDSANCDPFACSDDGGLTGCYWSGSLKGNCGAFWSSSSYANDTGQAFSLDFKLGQLANAAKGGSAAVRCVREKPLFDGDVDPDIDPIDTPACADGPCCTGGVQVAAGQPCLAESDVLSCTDDVCNAAGACTHPVKAGRCLIDGACYNLNDENPANSCQYCLPTLDALTWQKKARGAECDDLNSCTYADKCDGSAVCKGTALSCVSDPAPCGLIRTCQGTDTCATHYPASETTCNDAKACTYNDVCNGAGGCGGTTLTCTNNAGTCGLKRQCNGSDHCTETIPSTAIACATDNLTCTDDFCDGAESCAHTRQFNTCLIDGICYADHANNPANSCQWCDATRNVWANKPVTETCNDPLACTHTDHCDGNGSCVGTFIACENDTATCGLQRQCNGTDKCTETFAASGKTCNDANSCSKSDACNGLGACVGVLYGCYSSSPGLCEKLDKSTCNGDGTCTYSYVADTGASCTDNNACTYGDTCTATKSCVGTAISCAYGTCTGSNYCSCTSSAYTGTHCDSCAAGSLAEYPNCFIPASGYCNNAQCFKMITPTSRTLTCRNADGTEQIPCDSSADANEVVVDSLTGLTWQRTHGYDLIWADAYSYCSNLSCSGGGWRLPTAMQLQSIEDDTVTASPNVDHTAFPNTLYNGDFWTSTIFTYLFYDRVWVLSVDGGTWGYWTKTNESNRIEVRCVRGGYTGATSSNGGNRFKMNIPVNNVVTDAVTGLMWESATSAADTWAFANSSCSYRNTGFFSGWRLPSKSELFSLSDFAKSSPASEMPNTNSNLYWTSTSGVTVNFERGTPFKAPATESHYFRCVRGTP